jgi:hypothetical protein
MIVWIKCSVCGKEVSNVSAAGECADCDPSLVMPEKHEIKKKGPEVDNPPYFQGD